MFDIEDPSNMQDVILFILFLALDMKGAWRWN